MVHRSPNGAARAWSWSKIQHTPSAAATNRFLIDHIYYEAETPVPANAERLLRFACGLHGDMRATRAHVPIQTATETEQTLGFGRDPRKPRDPPHFS